MPRSKSAKNSPPVRSRVRKAPGYKAPDSVDYQALATFRLELRQFLAFSEANARRNRLTSQQYQALLTIRGLSGPTQCMSVGELAGLLLIRNHTAVELVARMAKIGLLKRFADAADGRRILLALTRKGEQKLASVAKVNWRELHAGRLALLRS